MTGNDPALQGDPSPQAGSMKSLFRQLFESFPDAMVIVDRAGKIRQANARAASLFGHGLGQLDGQSIHTLFPDQQLTLPPAGSGPGEHVTWPRQLVGCRSDSSHFAAEVSIIPLQTGQGTDAVMSIRDITEAQRAQFVLQRGLELLESEDRDRREVPGYLIRAQEDERARIAADIHDGTIQMITAANLRLQQLQLRLRAPEELQILDKLEEILSVSLSRLRQLIFDLRPSSLEHGSLGVALMGYLEQLQSVTEDEPAAGMSLHYARWALDMARGRHQEALADLQAAEQVAGTLVTPHTTATAIRACMLQTLVRMGQTHRVEAALAGLDAREHEGAEMRTTLASLRLAQHDPQAATAALAPVLDGSVSGVPPVWMVTAVLLEASARDALGDPDAAGRALERALDVAERNGMFIPFLVHPAPGLLKHHARQRTAHAAVIFEILSLIAETSSPGAGSSAAPPSQPRSLREPLSQAETRVLRYLPTTLTVPEIAGQLYLSVNTVRTHLRHVYDKLDAHRRHEAVDRARVLGLLAPSSSAPASPERRPSSRHAVSW